MKWDFVTARIVTNVITAGDAIHFMMYNTYLYSEMR
jgi:hypothetical protein